MPARVDPGCDSCRPSTQAKTVRTRTNEDERAPTDTNGQSKLFEESFDLRSERLHRPGDPVPGYPPPARARGDQDADTTEWGSCEELLYPIKKRPDGAEDHLTPIRPSTRLWPAGAGAGLTPAPAPAVTDGDLRHAMERSLAARRLPAFASLRLSMAAARGHGTSAGVSHLGSGQPKDRSIQAGRRAAGQHHCEWLVRSRRSRQGVRSAGLRPLLDCCCWAYNSSC